MIVRVKPGVRFTTIAPAGFRLLAALEHVARTLQIVLVVTCACDAHAAADPHTLGEAYDVRTKPLTLDEKTRVLRALLLALSQGPGDEPTYTGLGLATRKFYGQIENLGTDTEHLHVQRRQRATYP